MVLLFPNTQNSNHHNDNTHNPHSTNDAVHRGSAAPVCSVVESDNKGWARHHSTINTNRIISDVIVNKLFAIAGGARGHAQV